MSVYRTLELRGHDPIETIADALAIHMAGGSLPALPSTVELAPRALTPDIHATKGVTAGLTPSLSLRVMNCGGL